MFARACRDSEGQPLTFALRKVQGSEKPVPDRQTAPEILVEVFRVVGMVDLVMRRAENHAPQHTGGRDPDVRVLKMYGGEKECHQDQVRAAYLERTPKLQVGQCTASHPQRDAKDVAKHQAVYRVHAKIGERRKDFRGVVELVEITQQRNSVAKIGIK